MSADDDELRSFVRRAMGAAVPSRELESRALAGVVARARGQASDRDPVAREAAAMVAAAAQELSPAGAAIAAGASAPSLVKIVVAVVIAGAAGTVAWRSSNDTPATSVPVAVAPRSPAIAVPTPAEPPPARVPVVAPPPIEPAPNDVAREPDAQTRRRERSSSPPTRAIAPVEDTLVAETELVAAADRALARGDADEALAIAADHARRFADGQLALERRAIELSARCVLHRTGARDDAATFLRTHADTSAATKVRARCSDVDSDRSR